MVKPTNRCIDIVALSEKISIAIEVKTSFNFKVFEQALDNKIYFNYSYIAVPKFKDSFIQEKLCKDYGLGLLIYNDKYNKVEEIITPKFNRHTNNKYLITRLHECNKRSLPGTKSGDSEKITAFKITLENAIFYIKRHPGCKLKEMINNISHHYHSDKAACNNIYQWIRKDVIKEFRLEKGKLFLNDNIIK